MPGKLVQKSNFYTATRRANLADYHPSAIQQHLACLLTTENRSVRMHVEVTVEDDFYNEVPDCRTNALEMIKKLAGSQAAVPDPHQVLACLPPLWHAYLRVCPI